MGTAAAAAGTIDGLAAPTGTAGAGRMRKGVVAAAGAGDDAAAADGVVGADAGGGSAGDGGANKMVKGRAKGSKKKGSDGRVLPPSEDLVGAGAGLEP